MARGDKGGLGPRLRGATCAALLCGPAMPSGAAAADGPFVDTRVMTRHAGQMLPHLIPWEDALRGGTTFLYREQSMPSYEPGWEAVAGAPKPVAAMAGVSEASTATTATRLQAAGSGWAAGAGARSEQGHSYRDGDGRRVNFGYQRDSEWLGARLGKAEGDHLSLGIARDVFDDAKLPNYGMDVDSLSQGGARLSGQSLTLPGWFNQAGAVAAWSFAHLDIDNYSLRQPASLRLAGESDHQTLRAGGWAAHDAGADRTLFGAEATRQLHTAKRTDDTGAISGYWLPGVEMMRASAWAEHSATRGATRLEGGLRYDLVAMRAADAHAVPALYGESPQQLYERYYGPNIDNDRLDHNVSARLRGERDLAPGRQLFADLSRLVRSPDATERYNGNGGPSAIAEVGNPSLVPEKHYKAELGGEAKGGGYAGYGRASPGGAWRLRASAWHDHVADFVTIDAARGQAGILETDRAVIYRNVDAAISGLSAEMQAVLTPSLATRFSLTGQRGRNLTDHRPLHQIPPFEANWSVDAFGGDADLGWNLGARLRAVAAKRSVDDSRLTGSGQDTAGPAGAFATLDLYAGLQLGNSVAVTLGVDNVFDTVYREHIKAVPQTSSGVMPYAPGRTLVLRSLVSF